MRAKAPDLGIELITGVPLPCEKSLCPRIQRCSFWTVVQPKETIGPGQKGLCVRRAVCVAQEKLVDRLSPGQCAKPGEGRA